MALTLACPKCATAHKFAEKHLGRKGRCRFCGELFPICEELTLHVESARTGGRFLLRVSFVGLVVGAVLGCWLYFVNVH